MKMTLTNLGLYLPKSKVINQTFQIGVHKLKGALKYREQKWDELSLAIYSFKVKRVVGVYFKELVSLYY